MLIFKEHKNINGEVFNTEQIGNSIFTEKQMAKWKPNLLWDQHVMQIQDIALPCMQGLSFTGLAAALLSIYFLNTHHKIPITYFTKDPVMPLWSAEKTHYIFCSSKHLICLIASYRLLKIYILLLCFYWFSNLNSEEFQLIACRIFSARAVYN